MPFKFIHPIRGNARMGVVCIIKHLTPTLTLPLIGGGNLHEDLLRSYNFNKICVFVKDNCVLEIVCLLHKTSTHF